MMKLKTFISITIITLSVGLLFANIAGVVYGQDGLHVKENGNVGIGTTSPNSKLDVRGCINTGGACIELNQNNSGNRYAFTDFHGDDTYTDYGLRILRHTNGPNSVSILEHRGTDSLILSARDAGTLLFRTNNTARLVIHPDGNIGIGTGSPSKKLYVNGSAGGTQSWNASDIRWKKDIQTIPNALDGIMKIRGVRYNWKDGSSDESTGFDDKTHYGVIAQEVEAAFPHLVDNPGESKEYKHVEYNALMGILIEAVKELKTENDLVKGENKTLKSENEQFRNKLASLTDRQAALEEMFLALSANLPANKPVTYARAGLDGVQHGTQ